MTRGEAVNWIINISADIGKAEHRELWHYEQALSEIREMLESEPERKKGKWICSDDYYETGVCSACEWDVGEAYADCKKWFKYCPNCGSYNGGD